MPQNVLVAKRHHFFFRHIHRTWRKLKPYLVNNMAYFKYSVLVNIRIPVCQTSFPRFILKLKKKKIKQVDMSVEQQVSCLDIHWYVGKALVIYLYFFRQHILFSSLNFILRTFAHKDVWIRRATVGFCMRLGKTFTQHCDTFRQAHRDTCISWTALYWRLGVQEGQQSPRNGRAA